MGIELVKLASVHGAGLSGNAFKVLIRMATTALDADKDGRPAGLYFGGWESLAIALGYPDGDVSHGSPGFQAVKRAVATLRKEGFVESLGDARQGTRQTYGLNLGLVRGGRKVTPSGGRKVTPTWGSKNDPQGGRKVTPLGHIEDQGQDLTQDEHVDSQPRPETARAGVSGKADVEVADVVGHAFVGIPGDDCRECGAHVMDRRAHPLRFFRSARSA